MWHREPTCASWLAATAAVWTIGAVTTTTSAGTIPQLLERQKLLASDGMPSDSFGTALDREGDTLIIGAPQHFTNSLPGSFYVFARDAAGLWIEQERVFSGFQPEQAEFGDLFGAALALQGDTLLVGAPFTELKGNPPGELAGMVYVFTRDQGAAWVQKQQLLPDDPDARRFGSHIALIGDTAIITSQSHAFVFTRDASGEWSQQAALLAWETGSIRTMAFDGQRIALTRYDPENNNLPQAVIFSVGQSGWGEPKPITSSLAGGSGFVVANGARFFSDRLALGVQDLFGPDYVFLFAPDAKGGWSEELTIAQPQSGEPYPDTYGFGAPIHGDDAAMIVGAQFGNRAFIFLPGDEDQWTPAAQLTPTDAYDQAQNFGKTVHLLDGIPIVASPAHHENGQYSGAVYVFDPIPVPAPGDLDGDGDVDFDDFTELLASWGEPGCGGAKNCPADIDGDGDVDFDDFTLLLANWTE